MNTKMRGFLGMTVAMAMMADQNYEPVHRETKPKRVPKHNLPTEIKQQKGQLQYWFRIDGTFISEKNEERMLKTECVFTCFSINDTNAIRKFKNNNKK